MKLDTSHLRYLTPDDWRVLTAVELGSRTHLLVPLSLIHKLSHSHSPSHTSKSLWALSKAGLVSTLKNARYEGFRLSYGGLDHLALRAHSRSGAVYSVGNQVGTGKESDVFAVAPPVAEEASGRKEARKQRDGGGGARGRERQRRDKGKTSLKNLETKRREQESTQYILKLHRLGRISFRSVRTNRDYLSSKSHKTSSTSTTSHSATWLHLSRLAALKEWTFLSLLYQHGFPVPKPIAHNRHSIVMELIEGFPLRQIESIPDPQSLYAELIELVLRLARYGLVHGDFNEFNILVREDVQEEDREGKWEASDESGGKGIEREIGQMSLGAENGTDEADASVHPSTDQTFGGGAEHAVTQSTQPTQTVQAATAPQSSSTTIPIIPATAATPPITNFNSSTSTPASTSSPVSPPKTSPRIKLTPILIDFPQMVSMSHTDAAMYFDRDVACIKRYFSRRFGFTSDEPGPFFADALKMVGKDGAALLDVEAYASGFSRKMARELETYLAEDGKGEGKRKEGGDVVEDGENSDDDVDKEDGSEEDGDVDYDTQ